MTLLCTILALVFVLEAALVSGWDLEAATADYRTKFSECKNEVGATDDEIKRFDAGESATTKGGKCLLSCMMKKYNVMDANGTLVKENLVFIIKTLSNGDEGKLSIINACADIKVSADHCQASEEYRDCLSRLKNV